MKSKSYYITVVYSLFLASFVFLIGFTTNWHLLSNIIFSIVFMIFVSWQAVKKFKERNLDIVFDNKRVLTAVAIVLLMAGITIFAVKALQPKHLTQTQKERLIVK
ncbi:MAG: hypothetical protein ACMG51_04945 [Ginsengibacter sp.]